MTVLRRSQSLLPTLYRRLLAEPMLARGAAPRRVHLHALPPPRAVKTFNRSISCLRSYPALASRSLPPRPLRASIASRAVAESAPPAIMAADMTNPLIRADAEVRFLPCATSLDREPRTPVPCLASLPYLPHHLAIFHIFAKFQRVLAHVRRISCPALAVG